MDAVAGSAGVDPVRSWGIATRVVLILLAVALAVLVVSGVYLWFEYRPSASRAWPSVRSLDSELTWSSAMRSVHRVAGSLTVLLAIATLVVFIGRRVATGGRGIVAGVGVLATALATSFTGYLLPWDQLALWAVTVGNNISGIQGTFRGDVKYVLIGSNEVSIDTYHLWAIIHVVLGALVATAVLLAWLRTRERGVSRSRRPARGAGVEPEVVG